MSNCEAYSPRRNYQNALTCQKSRKQIKNETVYCELLDQWLSVNYCAFSCRAPEIKINGDLR